MKNLLIIVFAGAVLSAPGLPLKDAYKDDFLIGFALGSAEARAMKDAAIARLEFLEAVGGTVRFQNV